MTDAAPDLKATLLPVEARRITYYCPKCGEETKPQAMTLGNPQQYVNECCGIRWLTPYHSGQIIYSSPQKDDSTDSPA